MRQTRQRKSKLDALIGREDAVRAALEEIRLRRRAQEKDEHDWLASVIGKAVLQADVDETDPARRETLRALIAEALDGYATGPGRAFAIAKSWLPDGTSQSLKSLE